MCVCVFHIITGYCHLNAAIIPEASHALVCLYLRPTLAFVTVQVSQAPCAGEGCNSLGR